MLTALAMATGCGDGEDRIDTHPARGAAMFESKPMTDALITLHPVSGEPKTRHLLPRGVVDAEGNYTLGTYRTADGAPVGDYKVTVVWTPEGDNGIVRPDMSGDKLQGRYARADKSDIRVTIKEGDNTLPPIELP
jgi:hypothetical protein